MMQTEFEHELQVATSLARKVGGFLRSEQSVVSVGYKAEGEIVTSADCEADRIIRTTLRQEFPSDTIYCEESGHSGYRVAARAWIVDPLDATSNYASGGDQYCMSIGLAFAGEPVLGVIYNPAREELFAGARGGSFSLNGKPAATTYQASIEDSRLLLSQKEWQRGLRTTAQDLPVRQMASMAYMLARVAAGMDDGVFCLARCRQWATCAGVALVMSAGGKATLLDGRAIQFNASEPLLEMGIVAAGPMLHPLLFHRLGEWEREPTHDRQPARVSP